MSQESNNIDSNNIGSRILFKATEIFGQLINKDNDSNGTNELKSSSKTQGLSTIDKTAQIIKEEYQRLFWVTGEMDLSLWEEDCTFADPFSSFGGPGSAMRFKSNANNLSKLLINPIGRVTEFEVIKDKSYKANDTSIERPADIVNIGWTFSSQLKLPWHPILAASEVQAVQYASKKMQIIYLNFLLIPSDESLNSKSSKISHIKQMIIV